ncbi:probable indole-3-pyruvate monooxygenase YUCCA10 [Solanum lycopersicum]|uniref:Flavin-containing monooxygenase n=1 Tax=Solanum lycopersicum TaxID=4081 RepID=D2IGV5_SOLLC|nr:probable indole-3-pyruvate monooxygenase YUCCA10 [Solanum lycopersicum]ACX33890.1 flavin monooxygenase-like protein [Solanum lycopersicum]
MATFDNHVEQPMVIIVGGGPGGLATSACLNKLCIPNLILEKEDCYSPMWKKYSYDRVHLHLAKQFCQLPLFPFPSSSPTYVPKKQFIQYLDDYVTHFNITPFYNRNVEFAEFDVITEKWNVKVRNGNSGEMEEYFCKFLVVATGEASYPFIPDVPGLTSFTGEAIHSTQYKNAEKYKGKNVLVVGCGNSGMEIALDLANNGANTSIIVRSPMHLISREMGYLALMLLKYKVALRVVDTIMVMLSKLMYGDISKYYGVKRPEEGPFACKVKYGKYPVFDVGTYRKIKSGEIQVLPAMRSIRGNDVVVENGKIHQFDGIVFATGFKRTTHKWLQGDDYLLNEDGLPKPEFPQHWKGKNGLYCVGLSRRGLYGIAFDAQNIATHINSLLSE